MWNYEKRLQFPIHIKNPNPALAAMIISQYGGPDGESSASMRYPNNPGISLMKFDIIL